CRRDTRGRRARAFCQGRWLRWLVRYVSMVRAYARAAVPRPRYLLGPVPMKGYATLPNCVTCGRFCTCEPGASWRMVYSGGPIPMPDHEQIQCRACTEKYGPLRGHTAGIFGAARLEQVTDESRE